jgi:hypothetical protein
MVMIYILFSPLRLQLAEAEVVPVSYFRSFEPGGKLRKYDTGTVRKSRPV